MPHESTLDANGPFASALKRLEHLGCMEEVGEVRRLLVEWVRYREEAMALRADLVLARTAARQEAEKCRQSCLVARQCLQNWRSLALIHQSRRELEKIDATLAKYPWLCGA